MKTRKYTMASLVLALSGCGSAQKAEGVAPNNSAGGGSTAVASGSSTGGRIASGGGTGGRSSALVTEAGAVGRGGVGSSYGGTSSGGSVSANGATASYGGVGGNAPAAGGSAAAGGKATAAGGSAAGGKATAAGGSAAGGKATAAGGSAAGGKATAAGGSAAGGKASTGGSANGGSTSGGVAAGGKAATGGASATGGGSSTAQGLFPTPLVGFGTATIQVEGLGRHVDIYVPNGLAANPPLMLIYHGTGGTPLSFMDELNLKPVADANGFIVVGAQGIVDRMGEPDDVDHFREISYLTGWNIVDENPATNEDVVLTVRMIDEAIAAYKVDPRRIYAVGNSNGGFMSYFVAATLPNRIAAFAEGSAGAMRCQNRNYNGDETQFMGVGTTCAALKLEPGYPTCAGQIEPARFDPAQRVPPGYLANANNDDRISVAFTCTLKEYMGNNAEIIIYNGGGHGQSLGYATSAWAFLSTHSL